MKKTIILISLISLTGCSQFSTPDTTAPNIETNDTSNTGCPKEPGALAEKPEKIALASAPTRVTGPLQSGKDVAYTFSGKKGQKLSYSSPSSAVSAVVYSWDLDAFDIQNFSLPEDGEYTIQLSSLSGDQTYEVDLGLDVGSVAASPAVSSPLPVPVDAGEKEKQESSGESTQELSETEAVKIVQSWLDAKAKIFAPPFNLSLVDNLVVSDGPMHKRTAGSSGSVQWLKDNGFYYTYRSSTINRVVSYGAVANGRLSLKVEITEDLSLHGPRGVDRSKSGRSTDVYEYILGKDGSTWKLYDSGTAS